MTNLIALQDQLKGLRDEDLDREIENPSGAAPVFMVASEKQRRQQMRQAYEGEKARQAEGGSTVLEDLMSARGMAPSMPPAGAMSGAPGGSVPPGPMGAPGGLGDAVPGFANGGLIDFASISTGYGGLADQLTRNREQNKWLALAQIGAGIAGGESPSFATNVGQGSAQGLRAYQEGVASETQDQLALLQAQAGLLAAQDRSALAERRFTFEQEQAARDELAQNRRLELAERQADRGPAAVQTFEYYQGLTPEEQARFRQLQELRSSGNTADLNTASTAYRRSREFAEDKVGNEPKFAAIRVGSAEIDPKLQAEYEARVRNETNLRFIDFYPHFQRYLPLFGQGQTMAPAGTAAPSGITFVEGLPEGATVKDLTSPIMRGASSKETGAPVTYNPENFTYVR